MAIDKYTAQLTKDTMTSVTSQYFDVEQPFAIPRTGNDCHAYLNGRDYLAGVANALREAESFVLIADWQLDIDVELDSRGMPGHPGRLSELVYQAMQRGVHVRIMLYDSVERVLDTHDDTAQAIFKNMPKGNGKGSIDVLLGNPNTGRPDLMTLSSFNLFFSHHQKFVVVDGKIGFIGGLDLAYGRWDTNSFDVVIDPKQRIINDAYNMQLSPARVMSPTEWKLTQIASFPGSPAGAPPFQASYAGDQMVFDEKFQPRQPWQDVAMHITGPAVYDIFVNFILRWNSFAGTRMNAFDSRMGTDWFAKAKGADYLVDPLAPGEGKQVVQICRSVSDEQLRDELHLWGDGYKYIHDDWKKANPTRRKIMQDARKAWAGTHQTSIRDAMINCIRSAKATIYIENQFFISDCGTDAYGTKSPAVNSILSELARAIGRAIFAERAFHVWIVLPAQPEGKMEEAGTAAQAWWALQGIKRGNNSLVNRINATILKKHMKAWGINSIPSTNIGVEALLKAHGMEDEWRKYLTVMNLRNYGHSATTVMTEMIYVHSKLLIVDDAVAIIGSANINDRSLNGNGDSELAAVVVDTADAVMTDMGQGIRVATRKFARDLRINLWKKHLGMLVDVPTTGVQKEPGPPNGINIGQPLSSATISGMLALARKNAQAYERVFLDVPRNKHAKLTTGRELAFPILDAKKGTRNFAASPALQPQFMDGRAHKVAQAHQELRAHIHGFFVEMPLELAFAQGKTPKPPAGMPQSIAHQTTAPVPQAAVNT